MIVTNAEARVALGLMPTITEQQQSRLILAMSAGHAAVKKHLAYDPEQKSYDGQLYPRAEINDASEIDGIWDVNSAHTRAVWEARNGIFSYLQLEHLPVRQVTEVLVDPSALFGQQSDDFGTGTAWSQGVEYMVEWDQKANADGTIGVCRTGQLISRGAWPVTPGTVKVSYKAGYSPAEFAGQALATNLNDDGKITMAGVDASAVKTATLLEVMRYYLLFKTMSLNSLTGLHVAGPLQSESLGSYSYSLASGQQVALLTGMQIAISPEAAMHLDGFVHYGQMVL